MEDSTLPRESRNLLEINSLFGFLVSADTTGPKKLFLAAKASFRLLKDVFLLIDSANRQNCTELIQSQDRHAPAKVSLHWTRQQLLAISAAWARRVSRFDPLRNPCKNRFCVVRVNYYKWISRLARGLLHRKQLFAGRSAASGQTVLPKQIFLAESAEKNEANFA